MTEGPPVETLYEPIKNEAMLAHAEFQLWDQLYATHPARIDILNATAGSFFAMLNPIMAEGVMMRLSRLTDPPLTGRRRNLTLTDLAEILDNSSTKSDGHAYRAKLSAIQSSCESMRVRRNKRLAHLDFATATITEGEPLPGVRVSDIRKALALLQEALNIFEKNQGLPRVMYSDFVHPGGSLALLAALKRTLAYKKHVVAGTIDPRRDDLTLPQRETPLKAD